MAQNTDPTTRSPNRARSIILTAVVLVILLAVVSAFLLRPPALAPGPDPSAVSPTPVMTESEASSATATPSAGAEESVSPTASPATLPSRTPASEGAYGPVWDRPADEAFVDPIFCENENAVDAVGEPTDVHYRVAMPGDWYTNQDMAGYSACSLFGPQPIEASNEGSLPEGVVIGFNLVPGGNFDSGGSRIESQENYTVADLPSVRYVFVPTEGGFITYRTVVWIIGIDGVLPVEGNTSRYLAVETNEGAAANAEQFAGNSDVLDRMISTFELLDSGD